MSLQVDTGKIALDDIRLLSTGHHLIGGVGSTYTLLIQECEQTM